MIPLPNNNWLITGTGSHDELEHDPNVIAGYALASATWVALMKRALLALLALLFSFTILMPTNVGVDEHKVVYQTTLIGYFHCRTDICRDMMNPGIPAMGIIDLPCPLVPDANHCFYPWWAEPSTPTENT